MSPLEPSYLNTAGPEYSNMAETQEKKKSLKNIYMKSVEILKEEMKKSFKGIEENKQTVGGNEFS